MEKHLNHDGTYLVFQMWTKLKDYYTTNLLGITAQEGQNISFNGLNQSINQLPSHISVDRQGYIERFNGHSDLEGRLLTASRRSGFPSRPVAFLI